MRCRGQIVTAFSRRKLKSKKIRNAAAGRELRFIALSLNVRIDLRAAGVVPATSGSAIGRLIDDFIGVYTADALKFPTKDKISECTSRGIAVRMEYPAMQGSSDEELMIHLQAGHHDALAVIVDRYQRLVWSVAKRIVHDGGEAEDVVQIVFLELFKKMELFDPRRGTLKVWLLQLAYTKSINRRYHLQRRRFYDQPDVTEQDICSLVRPTASPFRLSTAETARLVGEVMATLNPNQRTAVELISMEGLTFEELATRTAETLSNAKHHYYRGMMKLREFLSAKTGECEPSKRQKPIKIVGRTNA
jgi:RNA polymerase sigma-70 factor (ECF subfamily)